MRADDLNVDWFSSSYSNNQGGNCVQGGRITGAMALDWFSSSYSNNQGGECVQGGRMTSAMAVRDSKLPHGSAFVVTAAPWTTFITALRQNDLTA
ncbi:DUF397 domain-containing protein [Streptomyces roseirectus]|uniref:DUF397 domain-containing protein n=1 Tax=Streptomyces roseirectus TaxID=2768066 RepID=A0A7H0ITP4_9ACTN|nr:DUF397 domain-containing protein [Streptomyces roseirectus]